MKRQVRPWWYRPRQRLRPPIAPKTGERRFIKKFLVNLAVFAVLSLALQYAELSRIGQETLDSGYDYLIRDNFKKLVLEGEEPNPISPDLRLVFFETLDYAQSYTKGYWTPRDEVGLAILNSLRRGARIVLVDFSFSGEAPTVLEGERPIDGTKTFLELLVEAAELARSNKAAILVPVVSSPPPKGYLEILGRYRDVFRPADFSAMRDSHDGKVRRLRWFSFSNDYAPILSAGLLADLIFSHVDEAAAVREAKGLLVGATAQAKLLPPAKAKALKPEEQKASSRIIFRILPRAVVAREFGSGLDASRGVVWRPRQIASNNLSEPDFTGKIVLIGSDYQENGDFHQTTFGPMAGSYILANGLNMILAGLMIEEAKGLNLALLIITGFLASVLYARFPSYMPTTLFFGVALVSPWLSSWVFIRYNFFLDVWLPALGIGAYNLIAENFDWEKIVARLSLITKFFKRR